MKDALSIEEKSFIVVKVFWIETLDFSKISDIIKKLLYK